MVQLYLVVIQMLANAAVFKRFTRRDYQVTSLRIRSIGKAKIHIFGFCLIDFF